MKQKQEMKSRSVYMPESFWKGIDEIAKKEDLSANQVIRRLVAARLSGTGTALEKIGERERQKQRNEQ